MTRRTGARLAALLHADVVGSTEMVRQDEWAAHLGIKDAFTRLSQTIADYGGQTLELRGDALVGEFQRAADAVAAAVSFQSRAASKGAPSDKRPHIRVGIAIGEVLVAHDIVTGAGIILAQRLEQLAAPGGIVVHGALFDALSQRTAFAFEDLGYRRLKGFEDAIRALSVTLSDGRAVPPSGASSSASGQSARVAEILARPEPPTIAVLPFRNLSSDPDQAYFSDAITEDIIDALSRFGELQTIAKGSTFNYREPHVDVRAIGDELGAQFVLQGSVRRANANVRVSAQLVDASTSKQIWSERYDRMLGDVFVVQDEVTEAVAASVGRHVDISIATNRQRRRPVEVGPWELAAEAEWHVDRLTQSGLVQARNLCERCIEQFPDHSQGHASLAYLSFTEATLGIGSKPPHELLREAEVHSDNALALDPENERVRTIVAYVKWVSGFHADATREGETALLLNPNYAMAHGIIGTVAAWSGPSFYPEAVESLERALRLSPRDPKGLWWCAWRGLAEFYQNDLDAAIEWTKRSISRNSAFADCHLLLAVIQAHAGNEADARAALNRCVQIRPEISVQDVIARGQSVWRRPEDLELYVEGMRLAGFSET